MYQQPIKPILSSLLLTGVVLLCGCSTTSAQSCLQANWYDRGADAGAAGLPITEVLRAQNDCAHFGVAPDRGAFTEGWRKHYKQTG